MTMDGVPVRSDQPTSSPEGAFELERFTWAGPDRLELAGTFAGLGDAPSEAPVLVIHGANRVHRLPAADSSVGPPEDGRPWQAAFAWQETPEPFEAAELELGVIAIPLPKPGSKRSRFRQARLPVHRPAPPDGARQIGLEAELLTAREQIRELRLELEGRSEELARAQQALEAERERRAGDAERFRAGITQVRGSAEEALTAAQAKAAGITAERDEATAERGQAIAERDQALAERDALRAHVKELEARALESARQLEAFGEAREAAGEAGADAERLVARLQALRSALGPPS